MTILLNVLLTILGLLIFLITLPFRLIYALVRKLLGIPPKPRPAPRSEFDDLEVRTHVRDDMASLNVNLDSLSPDEQEDFRQVAVSETGFDLYEGHIKHGYDIKHVKSPDSCPKCKAPTEQMYANFVYATKRALRVMLAPAGYFCAKCQTVIIDQSILRGGVSRGFKFQGVMGIEHPKSKKFEGFKTWNAQLAVYIMDEEDGSIELTTMDRVPPDAVTYQQQQEPSKSKREKAKRRSKIAKQSRKRNRRKK